MQKMHLTLQVYHCIIGAEACKNFGGGLGVGKTKPLGMPTAGALNGLCFVGIPSVFRLLKSTTYREHHSADCIDPKLQQTILPEVIGSVVSRGETWCATLPTPALL